MTFFASHDLLGKLANFEDFRQLNIKYWHVLGKVVNNQLIKEEFGCLNSLNYSSF